MTSAGRSASSTEVAHEAEDARANLVETLDQLKQNLRPENMVREVVSNARIGADTITDSAYKLARENPLPALLIGAGCALVMGLGARAGGRKTVDQMASRLRSPVANAMGARSVTEGRDPRVSGFGRDAVAAADDGRRSLRMAGSTSTTRGTGQDTMRSDTRRIFGSSRSATSRLTGLLHEQPFILAALGVAVGAAIGAAIPTTDIEDDWMGGASASVRHAAQDLARDEIDGMKDAATRTADNLRQSAREHGISTDNLNDMVRDAGEHAKAAIRDVGSSIDHSA